VRSMARSDTLMTSDMKQLVSLCTQKISAELLSTLPEIRLAACRAIGNMGRHAKLVFPSEGQFGVFFCLLPFF